MEAYVVHVPTSSGGFPVAVFPTLEEALTKAREVREEFRRSVEQGADDAGNLEIPPTLRGVFAVNPVAEAETEGWSSPSVYHLRGSEVIAVYCPCPKCNGKPIQQVAEEVKGESLQDTIMAAFDRLLGGSVRQPVGV